EIQNARCGASGVLGQNYCQPIPGLDTGVESTRALTAAFIRALTSRCIDDVLPHMPSSLAPQPNHQIVLVRDLKYC
ncbi:hypothetical protein, partial [Burkholderia sp. Bp9140]|uniref:hypothetical protein n=1 Tax=Burkholderia sp. Bp9140 TaxID=2184572 RepID=UPI001C8A65C7